MLVAIWLKCRVGALSWRGQRFSTSLARPRMLSLVDSSGHGLLRAGRKSKELGVEWHSHDEHSLIVVSPGAALTAGGTKGVPSLLNWLAGRPEGLECLISSHYDGEDEPSIYRCVI